MSGPTTLTTDRAALAALLSLPALGPARLRSLLDRFETPERAWEAVRRGRVLDVDLRTTKVHELADRWRRAAGTRSVDDVLGAHRAAGVDILVPGDPDWPPALLVDPEPPEVLFVRGDPALLQGLSVAVIGTRRCTAAGAAIARAMGRDLAGAGVPVVSGLAAGIDGAAHRGLLEGGGRPIGVVATGLDVVYPKRHVDLWASVGEHGVLVSEAALGVTAERWRFPSRNRLIAAFAVAVVVVESPASGGSITTVDAAVERGTPVLAVPGSVLSPQSAGTNQLLFDGCAMVRGAADVLGELGTALPPASGASDRGPDGAAQPELPFAGRELVADDPLADRVLDALSPSPTGIDAVVELTGASLTQVTTALARLEGAGLVQREGAGYRRSAPPPGEPTVR